MNTYKKYCPNVFLAQCKDKQEKGNTIIVETKYGKENECIVHNLIYEKNGYYYYSITRLDGYNSQIRARNKAERLSGYAFNANKRSGEAYERADLSEEKTGIPFGQPILVGHHSERSHRRVIERADNAMRKSIEEKEKAKKYESRAQYWDNLANKIDLSMPESIEFFEFELEKAKKTHKYLKDNPDKRPHSLSLTYANKKVKELKEKVETAIKLWGSEEEIQQLNKEKEQAAKKKVPKRGNFEKILKEYGGFFFFGSDAEAFKIKYNYLLKAGYIEEGEKICHITSGLYVPAKHKKIFLNSL